jgi:hypothetical protein
MAMLVAKSRVVNLFILLGCPKAAKWNDDILTGRVATLHELFEPEMEIDSKYQKLFEKIYNASKNGTSIEIINDADNPVEPLLKNMDVVSRMKPIVEPDGNTTIKAAVSDSEVTIVPDVDEKIDDVTDECECCENEHKTTSDNTAIESDPTETNTVETEKITQTEPHDAKEEGKQQSANLPVYKSRLGKPQQVRRPLFNFEMLNIPVGAKLYFTKDPSKCVTIHDKKKVIFEEMFGEEPVSLTNLTKTLLNLPRDVQPTGYWTYEGITLKKLYYDKFPDTNDKPAKTSKRSESVQDSE